MNESQHTPNASDFKPTPEFLARKKRMDDAMHLRKPDRVPVVPLCIHFYSTRVRGISNKDAMYQQDRMFQALKEDTLLYDWDAAPPSGSVMAAKPLEILGIKQFKWPGGDLSDDQPFQWVEDEYMKITEYDEMLADPNGFAVKKLWPRISSTLAPVSSIVQAPPLPLFSMSNAYTLPFLLGGLINQPHIRELLEKALALADESVKGMKNTMSYVMEMRDLGYPIQWTGAAFPPFDWVSNSLRGLKGSSTDMFRAPEKLLATIEKISAMTIGGLTVQAQKGQNKGVCIFMHRGADGFMSKKQFETFYWPSFRSLLLGLIDAGLTPIALFEGDYTSRLEFLQEFPPGKIVGHFDRIDRKKAKKLIGDVMCFWGNIPASLMVSGTPQQVKDDVKELIDIFGDNGGLIIDSINGFPDESKPENVQAVTEAVHEFGVY